MLAKEAAARTAKADRMAAVLIAEGHTADEVAKMGRRAQLRIARAAGTRPPGTNGETWATVVDVVRGHWHFQPVTECCRECGDPLTDLSSPNPNRYTEASNGRCGRCRSSEYA